MIKFARTMTDAEMQDAAHYFSSMKWTPWICVVEGDTIPKVHLANGIFLRDSGTATESIGNRIVETPEDVEATEVLRDDRLGFVAYVPGGSVEKGEHLAKTGGAGKTQPCANCHGAGLLGMDPIPGLAGRSPSYIGRQLYDMQHGFRKGEWTSQMQPVVEKPNSKDILDLAAYAASLSVTAK